MARNYFEVLSEPFKDEDYLPDEERRAKSKTIPKNGGRTPDTFEVWDAFEEEVLHFIKNHRVQLQASTIPSQRTPRMLGMEISNEAEVRSAVHLDCTQLVGLAMRFALERPYTIKSADDQIVKGNMDYAGFSLNSHSERPESVVLPIEIKGPWQLDVEGWETLPMLMKRGGQDSARVRNAICQIFMYMVMSETQYGVLCSKSKFFFFRRSGDPQENHLEVSQTICNDSSLPSARQCWLYVSHLALNAEVFPSQWLETTPPELKWVTIPRTLGGGVTNGRAGLGRGRGGLRRGSAVRSGSAIGSTNVSSSADVSSSTELPDVDWFFSLPDICLSSLELGKIVHKTFSSTVFSHKSNPNRVIKMYEFSETFETLHHFKREIDAYIHLGDLHGLVVPRVYGYGASWGHFLGFISMEALGPSINEEDLTKWVKEQLMDGLQLLHCRKVYHGDLNLRNIVLPLTNEDKDECDEAFRSFQYRFIDFGESVHPCDEAGLEFEKEQFQNFLNGKEF